ncbi:sulfotransferase [Actinomadura fulvescens]|uniref:Sulfotransferase domain-containing protein n=1 Tax=Actinomadura fulvescens TaxID=46160 RepID=A0ABP6CER7_9ACTN
MTVSDHSMTNGVGMAQELPNVMLPTPVPLQPEGWVTGPPDFVGVGVMKAGTTWWWSLIAGHPDVAPPQLRSSEDLAEMYTVKERHFFAHYGQVEDIDPAVYHAHFPRPPGLITGEWTPSYQFHFWVPPMLQRCAPKAKILVILRDPLERFISGLAHHALFGYEINNALLINSLHRGFYWQQLMNLLEYFDREQVLVLQYERCCIDTVGQLRRTFEFLGIDPGRWNGNYTAREHVGVSTKGHRLHFNEDTMRAVRCSYAADTQRLLADFPEVDGALWRSAP